MQTLQLINTNRNISTIFPWTARYGYYKLSLFDSAIDIVVSQYANASRSIPANVKPKWIGLWEISIGCKYLSRDTEKFFEKPEQAITAAEKVVEKIAQKILEKIAAAKEGEN